LNEINEKEFKERKQESTLGVVDKRVGLAGNKKTSPAEVPILIYGDDNNFPIMCHQLLSMVALEKWGNSARFITTGKAFKPDEIDPRDYDLEDDPHKLNLDELRDAVKSRNKVIAKIEEDEPSVYAFIYRHLSN
jgi:hypothetical protein